MLLLQKRYASVINYAKLIERNIELGRFSYGPRPPFYMNQLERSDEIKMLQKKPWKELTRDEARKIYFSYFPTSLGFRTYKGKMPVMRRNWFLAVGGVFVFIFGNLFFDYLIRLWDWYILYDQFMRHMTHEKLEEAYEFYARVQGNYQYDSKLKYMRYYQDDIGYKNSTSDRTIFNPLKWFRDEEKRLAKLKLEDEKNELSEQHSFLDGTNEKK